jgi:K+ transporter
VNASPNREVSTAVRWAAGIAGLLLAGAILLAVTRADALLLDLARFAGCL